MKNHIQIYTTFAAKSKSMKKKRNKSNWRSFSKRNYIIKEVTKASVELIKKIIYDFWIILLMWILYNLIGIT